MTKINHDQLHDILLDIRGATFVTIVARTVPKLLKTGNPYLGCTKVARVNGMINWVYANSVNNQRKRESTPVDKAGEVIPFVPEARRWGQRRFIDSEGNAIYDSVAAVRLSPFVDHKGIVYLELKVERSIEYSYELNGEVITAEQIKPFLPKRKEGRRQQVEKTVILRDYTLSNIEEISVNGEHYELV